MRTKQKRGTRRERLPLDEVPEADNEDRDPHAASSSFCASVGDGGPRSAAHAAPLVLLALTFAAGMYAALDGSWCGSPQPMQGQGTPPSPPPHLHETPSAERQSRARDPGPQPPKRHPEPPQPPTASPPPPPPPPPPPLPSPSPPPPPPQQSPPPPAPPPATWQEVGRYNCWWDGHGVGVAARSCTPRSA
jgi:hypothetical protein